MTERIEIYILSQLQFHFIFLQENHWWVRFALYFLPRLGWGEEQSLHFPKNTSRVPLLRCLLLGVLLHGYENSPHGAEPFVAAPGTPWSQGWGSPHHPRRVPQSQAGSQDGDAWARRPAAEQQEKGCTSGSNSDHFYRRVVENECLVLITLPLMSILFYLLITF